MEESSRTRVGELYESGNIYQELPLSVLDKIMKYHRMANLEIEPKKTVLLELKRINEYMGNFCKKLNSET